MSRPAFIFLLYFPFLLFSGTYGAIEICPKIGTSKNDPDNKAIPTILEELKQLLEIANSRSSPIESSNFNHFHLRLSHPAITLDGDITNGTLTITKPKINYLRYLPTGLEIFNLTFPKIDVDGTYNVSGYIGAHNLFDIFGSGNFYVNLANFSIAALTGVEIDKSRLCIPFEVNVYVAGSDSYFENLMNDSELCALLNDVFNNIIPDILKLMFRDEADKVDRCIQKVIDFIMGLETSGSKKSLTSFLIALGLELWK